MVRLAAALTFAAAAGLAAPSPSSAQVARIVAEPAVLTVAAGESVRFELRAVDARGRTVEADLRVVGARGGIRVSHGEVMGLEAGEYEIYASTIAAPDADPVTLRIPVVVTWPPVTRVEVPDEEPLYVGTRRTQTVRAYHADGTLRPHPTVTWRASDPAVADVDPFGNVRARAPGPVTITAVVEGVEGRGDYQVRPNPVVALNIIGGVREVRTGDVQTFYAETFVADGRQILRIPVTWSYTYQPDDSVVAPSGPAQITGERMVLESGRMVAEVPGVYTVIASSGAARDEFSFRVVPRDVVRSTEVVGQGRESRVFTTDFWIWEGLDGRDYAMTGSKFGDGIVFVWDVTDPATIVKTDSIQVDARTTNDIKVSPDGRYGVISREGASNRRNGVVILDLADPAHPRVASTYEDHGLTGGVHNMFATDSHLFALAGGDKYVILDMSDIYAPRYVSEYNHPDSRVHDVWVHDGLAYSAEWGTGVVVVDVGNGRWGGSVEAPVFVTSFPLPTGSTHAVFPYYQESTGRFLLIVGDERVNRRGLAWEGSGPDHRQQYDPVTGKGGYPRATSGYIQIVDFTDPMEPRQIARYEVREYGTHNMWVEDDVLYQAYYEGGVRMVDMSGDLMGNLYTQGREMAVFKAHDPVGYIPNSPGAWSVMPYKGTIFFSDINSGMWAVRMAPEDRPIS